MSDALLSGPQRGSRRTAQRLLWVISLLSTVAGGFVGFVAVVGASGAPQEADRESGHAVAPRPSFKQVIKAVEAVKGVRWERFYQQYGDSGRDLAIYLGREVAGLTLGDLAQQAGVPGITAASMALQRFRLRLIKEKNLRAQLQKAKAHLSAANPGL